MAKVEYDRETAQRRTDAYIQMLRTAYQVDDPALADMLGINRGTWTKFVRADFGDRPAGILMMLADVTGISLGWLFCEESFTGKERGSNDA